MESGYLIDTNVVIDYLSKKMPLSSMGYLSQIIDTAPQVSIISKIEILGFNSSKESQDLLVSFMNDVFIINLTDEIATETIAIRKSHKIKLPDAIIAATAKALDLTLLTRNIADFKNVTGLRLTNPWEI